MRKIKAKDFKELINAIDDNEEISFAVFDEYDTEVENVKLKEVRQGSYNTHYITLSAYNG